MIKTIVAALLAATIALPAFAQAVTNGNETNPNGTGQAMPSGTR